MAEDVKPPLAGALLCAALVGLLALLAYGAGIGRHLDASLAGHLLSHRHGTGGEWAEAIAPLADPLPMLAMAAAACAVALFRGAPERILAALIVLAGANVTTQGLKFVLAHPRAQQVLGGGAELGDVAFPSGHATAAASIAIALLLVTPAWIRPLAVGVGAAFALAVGAAVIVLGWHYPSDVLGGYLVAAGWGLVALATLAALRHHGERAGRAAAPNGLGATETVVY